LIDGIADPRHDDRDGLGCQLYKPDRGCTRRDNNVDFQAHQFLGKYRQLINSSFSGSILDGNVPALAQPAIAEAVAEILQKRATSMKGDSTPTTGAFVDN